MRLKTRHGEDFDIFAAKVDPSLSSYANIFSEYVEKVRAFYATLGISSAIWTSYEDYVIASLELEKPVEYVLSVNEKRAAAFVEEWSWVAYLAGESQSFTYSLTPVKYEITSILVPTPLIGSEVVERRRYRYTRFTHGIPHADRFECYDREVY